MKIWQKLLAGVLLALIPNQSNADRPYVQEGVIVQRTGSGYLYLFPAAQGRIKSNQNPAGVISVGESITVMYSLKLIGRAKTRFIGLDASKTKGISPQLNVIKASRAFGFFVRDINQSTLSITIQPSFMRKLERSTQTQAKEAIATQGNLNVTLHEKRKKVVIKGVDLD